MEGFDLGVVRLAKFLSFIIKLFRLGSGATWPGEIALRIRPHLLDVFGKNSKIIIVAGTNGKTTTVKMIESILKKAGKKVARNASGANLDNGLLSAFIANTPWSGILTIDYFIFEVDEATLPHLLKQVTPELIVLLNLFRDQLDRYGEVDTIAEKWLKTLQHSFKNSHGATQVIINGDDPHLAYIGYRIMEIFPYKVKFFGLNNAELFLSKMQHATDSIYCPKCGNRLTFGGVYFSHLGKYACGRCGFTHPELSIQAKDVVSPMEGIYNIYNTLAASLVGHELSIENKFIKDGLASFVPAFGRMEEIIYRNKKIKILLSKNPTGFNESLRTSYTKKDVTFLFVLNDRIPDGTDVSWIWDVDFEEIKRNSNANIFVSGDRVYDLAVRLKYAGLENLHVDSSLSRSIEKAVTNTSEKETLWILATYSAMLDVRKILVGRKIL